MKTEKKTNNLCFTGPLAGQANYIDFTIDKKYIFQKNQKEKKQFTNNITVESINDIKNFRNFYNFHFKVYKDNQYWVAPFWMEFKEFFKTTNPYWSHTDCILFIAKKENKIVGRIAGFIDHNFCKFTKSKIGYFGFFECVNDFKIAKTLLKSVEEWLVSNDLEIMRGPIDGRIDIGCGFLLQGFESTPSLLSKYSLPYYIDFVKRFNMEKTRDFYNYKIDLSKNIPKKLEEKANNCISNGIKIRKFDRIHTNKELKWWIDLFLKSFTSHWGYVPVSKKEVRTRFGVKQLRWFVDSELFFVAEFNNSPIAYLWSTPDYNQIFKNFNGKLGPFQIIQFLSNKNQINKGKLHFIGIKKDFQNKDIGSLLNYMALIEMKNRGYKSVEVGLIDKENTIAHKTITITNAKIYKKFRVFDKNLKINN